MNPSRPASRRPSSPGPSTGSSRRTASSRPRALAAPRIFEFPHYAASASPTAPLPAASPSAGSAACTSPACSAAARSIDRAGGPVLPVCRARRLREQGPPREPRLGRPDAGTRTSRACPRISSARRVRTSSSATASPRSTSTRFSSSAFEEDGRGDRGARLHLRRSPLALAGAAHGASWRQRRSTRRDASIGHIVRGGPGGCPNAAASALARSAPWWGSASSSPRRS